MQNFDEMIAGFIGNIIKREKLVRKILRDFQPFVKLVYHQTFLLYSMTTANST